LLSTTSTALIPILWETFWLSGWCAVETPRQKTLGVPEPMRPRVTRIAICHPVDPAGHVPSGIDTFIRGVLKWAPPDLDYVLFGATSDPIERPVGKPANVTLGDRQIQYLPLTWMNSSATRSVVPLTVRYVWALRRLIRRGDLEHFDILDFHRIEPAILFRNDPRPKNILLHQDMSILRSGSSDIMWRYAPWLYESIERRSFREMKRIFAVRQTAVLRYARIYPEIAARFAFMPTWVDTTVFYPERSNGARDLARASLLSDLRIDTNSCLLIFVGRLDRQKDPLLLLEAVREAIRSTPRIHLIIVGDGELRSEVESASRANELQGKVSVLGVKRSTEIAQLLQISDLFVLSSAYEGMPIAVLEALATGLPVASTDVGEIRLLVTDGVNGQISAGRTPSQLADAINLALQQIDRLRGAPCENAVMPYHPTSVLGRIYDNHRRESGASQTSMC
jgi:glycosyltransferase involved in cell wall biosynthesis